MISTVDLSFGYENSSELLFSDLSFQLDAGECLAVMGPSGSGKTTLLRLLAGELVPSAGQIETIESPYLSPETLVAQNFRSVLDNSLLVADLRARLSRERVRLATDALSRVGLGGLLETSPEELSRGMRARLNLVQTLMGHSKLVLLDEPFANLDVKARRNCESAFVELSTKLSLTSVIVTHDFGTAVACADKVLIISGAPVARWEMAHRTEYERASALEAPPAATSTDTAAAQENLFRRFVQLCDASV